MKPLVEIEYCVGCRWMLRAAWVAQELLTTFEQELGGVTLIPSATAGTFVIRAEGTVLHDRRQDGGFVELKVIKQRLRDHCFPERRLGHSDTSSPSRSGSEAAS